MLFANILANALATVIEQVQARLIKIAQERGVVSGRRMRVDTTVVETNIHYPTDSSLMGDGVRVLTRAMKKITKDRRRGRHQIAQSRNRGRSVKLRVLDIARAARAKGPQSRDKLKSAYGKLLSSTSRVVKRFAKEIAEGVKRVSDLMGQLALDALRQHIDEMVPRVRQVMKQTRARIHRGDTRAEGKIVSLFEPTKEVIRKGKAAKPTECGAGASTDAR
jgi:IS5 family transposase